jgi:DNA mismatch endonuclease (patch repair protein)
MSYDTISHHVRMTEYPHPSNPAVSAAMRGNPRANTKPELALRSALHAQGKRFRKDFLLRTTAGSKVKVDLVFTKDRIAVFVDGCFWHGCPDHGNTPKVNKGYWGPKLRRNEERDARINQELQAGGWTVIRIWEHEPVEEAVDHILKAPLGQGRSR